MLPSLAGHLLLIRTMMSGTFPMASAYLRWSDALFEKGTAMGWGSPGRPARQAAVVAVAGLMGAGLVATGVQAQAAPKSADTATSTTCQLGNGVKHVISLVFDNVHFAR
ncbi:MAG TPA: hypothetical protein VGJ07_01895, partial [Rugosimonospora sp.]